jgi:hypothetical protein
MRSKSMYVNGVLFPSIRGAARFIADDAGKTANTVVKELRALWGARAPWSMYGKYWVERS